MREKPSKQLVIDADVAQAAGSEVATDPRAKHCRDFLSIVLSFSHRVVMTQEISNEWKRHQSRFARRWRLSMDARKKVERIELPEDETLREKILTTTEDQNEIEAMQKDVHLLDAALASDKTVISLDETVRKLFAQATQHVGEIRNVVWVNPERAAEEQPIIWLKNGAPPDPDRQLSVHQPQ